MEPSWSKPSLSNGAEWDEWTCSPHSPDNYTPKCKLESGLKNGWNNTSQMFIIYLSGIRHTMTDLRTPCQPGKSPFPFMQN